MVSNEKCSDVCQCKEHFIKSIHCMVLSWHNFTMFLLFLGCMHKVFFSNLYVGVTMVAQWNIQKYQLIHLHIICFQPYYDEYSACVANCSPWCTSVSELYADVGVYDIQRVVVYGCRPWLSNRLFPLRMAGICRCGLHRTLSLILAYILWSRLVLLPYFNFDSYKLVDELKMFYKYDGVILSCYKKKALIYKYFGQHLYQLLLYTF